MSRFFRTALQSIIIITSFYSVQLYAKPNVVVSTEPLYEIVAVLMKGVAEPQILLESNKTEMQLSNAQLKQLLAADMLIRIGDGFETQLGNSLKKELPLVNAYTITLSNYIPLLPKTELTSSSSVIFSSDRQNKYDLRFWMDPKLLSISVRYITPQLVRMDPEHQEQYLENEIDLLKQIKQLSKQTANIIQQMSNADKMLIAQVNPYLTHRFIQDTAIINQVKSSGIANAVCKKKEDLALTSFSLSTDHLDADITRMIKDLSSCNINAFAVSDFK